MLNALFFLPKNHFLTQISKRSTPTDLHHPDLHLAQFFGLESLKISPAYSKTNLGLKMEKFLQTKCGYSLQTMANRWLLFQSHDLGPIGQCRKKIIFHNFNFAILTKHIFSGS